MVLTHKGLVIPKLLEIEKEIVREVARGDKRKLKKSADRKEQISSSNRTNPLTDLCRLSQVEPVYHLELPHAQAHFYIQ